MKYAVRSIFKSLTANRRSKDSVAKKTRSTLLRMESLEERQLLSVTNPFDDAVAAGPAPSPYLTAVAEETIVPIAFSLSTLEDAEAAPTSSSSSKGTTETFKGTCGGGHHGHGSPITFTINVDSDAAIDESGDARLTLRIHDVDYAQGEVDWVYVNGQRVGDRLTGSNESWSTWNATFDASILKPGANTIRIDPDINADGWVVKCDWGELTVATVDSELTVDDVKLKCADEELSQEYALCGENAELSATITASDGFTLDDYEISNITWTVQSKDAKPGAVEKLFKATVSASEVQIEKISASKWSISYDGWTPEWDDDGKCTITCKVDYKTTDGEEQEASNHSDGEVQRTYTILLGQCWLDANKNITVKKDEQAFNSAKSAFKDLEGVKGGKTTLTSDEFNEYNSKKTPEEKWEYLQSILATSQKEEADGKLPDFYLNFSDYHFYIVVGKGTKESIFEDGKVLDLGNNDKKDEVVDYLYVPDAATIGITEPTAAEIEKLVRCVSYGKNGTKQDWQKGDLVFFANPSSKADDDVVTTSYVVTASHNTLATDFEGAGLENCSSNGGKSIYLSRGTEGLQLADILCDLDTRGVGYAQYEKAAEDIYKWIAGQKDNNIVLAGHSLGGAISQWIAAGAVYRNSLNKISDVVTFQSPGISSAYAMQFNNANGNKISVQHHISNGDIVSLAGQAFIGTGNIVTIHTYGEYQADGKGINGGGVTAKHCMWLLDDDLLNESALSQNTEKITVEDLNSYWFHYSVPVSVIVGNVWNEVGLNFVRGRTEFLRSAIGECLYNISQGVKAALQPPKSIPAEGVKVTPGDLGRKLAKDFRLNVLKTLVLNTGKTVISALNDSLTSKQGWRFDRINYDSEMTRISVQPPAFDYKGLFELKLQNQLVFPAELIYSQYGLESVAVNYSETKPYEMAGECLSLVSASNLKPISGNEIAYIDKLKRMNAAILSPVFYSLPEIEELRGNCELVFGKGEELAKIQASSFKINGEKVEIFASDFKITYGNTSSLGNISGLELLELQGSKLEGVYGTNPNFKLSGQGKYEVVLCDRNGKEQQVVVPNAIVTCYNTTYRCETSSALAQQKIELSGAVGTQNLKLIYSGGYVGYDHSTVPTYLPAKATINFDGVKYVFDGEKFVGDIDFAPEPETESPVTASTLDVFSAAESETSAYVEAVYGAWNGSKLTVKVAPTAQAIAEDAEISFFLDDDAEGFDGSWLADVPLSAATVDENGLYAFEFDFAGTEIPAGEYAVYCCELWEDAEQAVYSETFSANQTAANVVLSTSSVAFADTPVGQYATQEIVATNDGEAPARVTLGVEGAEFFVSGVDANGNQMESASFVLQAGESVTLTVYFVPGETGAKTGKLSLLKEDGETAFATVELAGTALEMAPTDLATSVDGAVVSASSVTVGDAFNVSCEVANLGEQFSDVATVTFYASQNADDLTSGVKLGTASVDYLAAGEKATAALSLTAFPELAAGNYYVGWVVETTNDSDASNNVAVWTSPLEVVAFAKDTFVVDSEAAVDEDGDGYFDAIAFQGTATVATAGDYVFHFALQTTDGTTIARVSQTFALVAGENEIAWNFDGNDVFRAGANGPYVATVGGFDATLETAAYAFAQFEGAQATFNGVYSDRGVDLDGDGKFETLTLKVGVDVAAPGAYRVAGTLADANGKFIAFDYPVAQELEPGQGVFTLTFDAIDIVAAASEGPYTLTNLRIEGASGAILNILDDVYETQTAYAVDDFENDVRFTGQNVATANDLDENGLYDNLTLQIGVQVQKDGAYTLRGLLVDVETNKITNISKTYELTTGSTTLEFVVDALTISADFFDGPYGVFGLQLIDADGETVAIGSSFRTDAYTALDFEHPTLTVSNERSDSLDENLNCLNVVFKATSENGGYYNANARLVDANGDEICWAATTITLNAGEETEVTLSFDYAEILEHGVGGPFFVDGFSMYNLYDSSVYESVFINEFHETAPYAIVLNVPEWNLADYAGYDEFVLDATTDANVTATLYGKNADGELDVLKAWDFVGSEAVATIVGQSKVAESLTIAAGAATLLAEISFDGGDGRRDSLAIAGTDGDDAFALGTEIVETTTPVYQNNPYEKLLQRYADTYGETSATYLRLKACYDAAYAQLQKCVVVKTATWGTVALENGAQIKFGGADDVAINAGAGNDSFEVNALNFAYTLVGGDGVDALDFSDAQGRLNVDMNATYRQYVVASDGGTLRLVGDFESVVGTARNDVVIGAADGLKFVGNGGNDSVTLVGGDNYVSLKDGAQSVVVRGGSAEIAIVDGDYSVVNVVGNKETRATLNATGDHISLFGGLSVVSAQIVGDFASLHCGATSQTTVAILGDYANVVAGAGADVVSVGGDRATIKTGAGDDQVLTQGAFANVDLGAGNDVAVIADGDAEATGGNVVLGGVGNDFIFAANASGTNRFHAGVGNDVVVGSVGNDYIYANGGNNVLLGLAGADRLFGSSGRDALVASKTANTSDLETKTRDEVIAWYAELYGNWAVDEDLEATLETLGETSEADGEKDWLYRGGGKRNLIFASALDGDFENALEKSPFVDDLRLD